MVKTLVLFTAGLGGLYLGADVLIRGASRLARDLGVNALVIGLTVVAMGTSMPELLVGMVASVRFSGDIAIGNVVGSNVANIALILGIGALIRPIRVQMRLLVREVPIMIFASLAFYVFALDGILSRWDGLALAAGFIAYTLYLLDGARRESPAIEVEYQKFVPAGGNIASHILLTFVGLAVLLGGAHMVVSGAAATAQALGISELAVGLTVVAMGTSLPELATAVAASVQDEGDILVGNVVGSNVFNLLAVLGAASIARPIPVAESVIRVEAPVMLAVSVIVLPFVWTTLRLTRWEAAILLSAYAAFVVLLALPS
ncbi:MAG: calcium/sodium antiporter [Gemmatimonadetes bacterium]|uniref:Calcium/sodium antiporter n=1 Tax=Candidatus Kutchimonas denitrificans TaxID=3056748 RepID=A0AAE4Z752_9BACT|nr:calcium/sodium antiporter [Gemmatimonadota bacterium]NIR75005.1 calcium/sodium antiporter [Candidatus Kutchimonas denitrificans]NIS01588.1 calcium/sodium antiporter [Gemmatimonadota bacterium]NIT67326.1 calcium/sodium antiporter [Gemmatimonadota bacterium]NIU52689.1 calcium/sodium antiporter [Gemmatimonadota bacterium]